MLQAGAGHSGWGALSRAREGVQAAAAPHARPSALCSSTRAPASPRTEYVGVAQGEHSRRLLQ